MVFVKNDPNASPLRRAFFMRGLYTRRWRAIIVVERLWMSVKKMNGNDELIEK